MSLSYKHESFQDISILKPLQQIQDSHTISDQTINLNKVYEQLYMSIHTECVHIDLPLIVPSLEIRGYTIH